MQMRARPHLAGLGTILLVATSGMTMGPPASSTPPTPSVTVSSVLLGRDGTPLPNTTIALSGLVPRSEEFTELVRIGQTVTDTQGRFAVSGNPSGLPTTDSGAVALELEVLDDSNAFSYGVMALPPLPSRANWRVQLPAAQAAALQIGRGLVEDYQNSTTTSLAAATSNTLVAPAGEHGESTEEIGPIDDSRPLIWIVDGQGGTSCPSGYSVIGWHAQQTYRYNYVPTKFFRTRSRSSLTWKIARSNETYLEVAFNIDGDKYGGGFNWQSKNNEGITYTPTAGNNEQKIFKVKWRYQRERKFCHSSLGDGHVWLLDAWRWVADRPESGNRFPDTTASVECGGTGPGYVDWISEPVSVSKSTSAGYNGFFTIIGVRLGTTQLDRDEQVFTVKPTGSLDAKICGSDDTPAYATFIKEMTY